MKKTIIIGGTKGIGKELVKIFSESNNVSVIGRNIPEKKISNVEYYGVDISDSQNCEDVLSRVVKEYNEVDNLLFLQRYRGRDDKWKGEIDVSLTATKNIIEQLSKNFSKNASIVIVSSLANNFIVKEQPIGYHVAKAGMKTIAKYFAISLGKQNTRVNCVSPGVVVKEESREYYKQNKIISTMYEKLTPLGRMCKAKEVADVIEFLCSSKASFITGQEIIVDGGISIQNADAVADKMEE